MSQFEYLAVLVSIIVGIALTQLLRGVGRMVTKKNGPKPYWIHLAWTLFFFIYILLFWWWEFRLVTVDWTLPLYFIVTIYATLLFFVCLVLHSGDLDGFTSYKEYYFANRRWLFALLIAITAWDIVDTVAKGTDYLQSWDLNWYFGHAAMFLAGVIGVATSNEKAHRFVAVICILLTCNLVYAIYRFSV